MLKEALEKGWTEILMIPRSFYWLPSGIEFGKCTYVPVVGQTDVGFAKFYSILYYMVSCTYMWKVGSMPTPKLISPPFTCIKRMVHMYIDNNIHLEIHVP